jgi:hypothetical protein
MISRTDLQGYMKIMVVVGMGVKIGIERVYLL